MVREKKQGEEILTKQLEDDEINIEEEFLDESLPEGEVIAETPKKGRLWSFVGQPLLIFLIIFTLFRTVLFNGYVPSGSMENTIMSNSWILGDRLSIAFGQELKRYDIIVFLAEVREGEESHVVKRVIGLPGDKVESKSGKLYVNGQETMDDFVSSKDLMQKDFAVTVPKGKYFLAGDNRANSFDSRKWDNPFINRESIVAKVRVNFGKHGISLVK